LFCVEAPTVRFEDIIRVAITGPETIQPLDKTFVDVCQLGSLEVVGMASPVPALVGAEIHDNLLHVRVRGDLPPYVTVKISGIRAGHEAMRFTRHTEEQMHKNNAFWDQAR
jgi:hypothetical protein